MGYTDLEQRALAQMVEKLSKEVTGPTKSMIVKYGTEYLRNKGTNKFTELVGESAEKCIKGLKIANIGVNY